MSNIFNGTGMTYFQVPNNFIGLLKTLPGNSTNIYMLVLYTAQKDSTPTVTLTSRQIEEVGVSQRRMKDALDRLADSGLVKITRTKGNGAAITFELMDIETALPIPTRKEKELSIDTLTRHQLLTYALNRLAEFSPYEDDNGVRAACPFHLARKNTDDLSFNTRTGQWRCFHKECSYHEGGHLIEIEVALSSKKGKTMTPTQAWAKIVQAIRGSEREEAMKQQALKNAMEEMASA